MPYKYGHKVVCVSCMILRISKTCSGLITVTELDDLDLLWVGFDSPLSEPNQFVRQSSGPLAGLCKVTQGAVSSTNCESSVKRYPGRKGYSGGRKDGTLGYAGSRRIHPGGNPVYSQEMLAGRQRGKAPRATHTTTAQRKNLKTLKLYLQMLLLSIAYCKASTSEIIWKLA